MKERNLEVLCLSFAATQEKITARYLLRELRVFARNTIKPARLDKFSGVLHRGAAWHSLQQTLNKATMVSFDRLITEILGHRTAGKNDNGNSNDGSHCALTIELSGRPQ